MAMSMFGPAKPMYEIQFNKYDTDKSGKISAAEFSRLVGGLGYALTDVEQALAVKLLDADGSGSIELKEFKDWWTRADRWQSIQLEGFELEKRKAAAETFNEFDPEKSGSIDKQHYDAFYDSLKEKNLTHHNKEKFLENLDASGDGKIQFKEFVEYLKNIGTFATKVPGMA